MHDGRDLANFILDYTDENGITVTNLSLQKIVYFCHVWFLVYADKPLVKQNFEAWEFGPVLPYLYRTFKEFKDKKITKRAKKLDQITGNEIIASIKLSKDEESQLEKIVSFYSKLPANQLVEESHILGGPWYEVWNHETKVNPGMQISNQSILKFYLSKEKPYKLQ